MKISQHTAKAINPIIRGMAQAGTLPRSEANTTISILNQAAKQQTSSASSKPKQVMLSSSQMASRLSVCVKTILRMRASGQLKGVNLTGSHKSLRFPESEIERLLNCQRVVS